MSARGSCRGRDEQALDACMHSSSACDCAVCVAVVPGRGLGGSAALHRRTAAGACPCILALQGGASDTSRGRRPDHGRRPAPQHQRRRRGQRPPARSAGGSHGGSPAAAAAAAAPPGQPHPHATRPAGVCLQVRRLQLVHAAVGPLRAARHHQASPTPTHHLLCRPPPPFQPASPSVPTRRVYKPNARQLYSEADSQGLRVWRDELVDGGCGGVGKRGLPGAQHGVSHARIAVCAVLCGAARPTPTRGCPRLQQCPRPPPPQLCQVTCAS